MTALAKKDNLLEGKVDELYLSLESIQTQLDSLKINIEYNTKQGDNAMKLA
jgi:chaperonin cofactor prefoldin